MNLRIQSYIERNFATRQKPSFCTLVEGQPLLLSLDPAGVMVSDLHAAPMGYICQSHAPEVRAKILGGEVLLSKVSGKCQCIARPIVIWSEGTDKEATVHGDKKLSRPKTPEKV